MEESTIFQPSAFGSVKPGTRLNGVYEIEKLLAQGGMGEVYRGFNIQTMDIVAIKMIRPEFSTNPEVFELFRREASILHNLVHEAIVRYFVFSVDPDIRRAYLAMEFVDGPSLTSRLASGPLPIADVRVLQRRIASALEAAHRLGIIHRDVSPDNIILPDADVQQAKIIDFGIARSLRTGAGTIIGGGFAGKYNYVSPEQLGLAGGEVTFKSDIYSFGLVLAEALLGRPLDMTGSQADIIEKRRSVPNLSGVDPSMRPLIQSMLQPSPANRPSSLAAVAEWGQGARAGAARRASGREPSQAGESSAGRAAAILGALIVIASLGGAVYVFRDDLSLLIRPPVGAPTAPTPPSRLPPLPAPPPAAGPSRPEPESAAGNTPLPPLTAPSPPPTTPETQPSTPPAMAQPQIATAQPETPAPVAPPLSTPPPAPPNPSQAHVPTSTELLAAMPPRASLPVADLPPATVGTPYRAELPGFTDHGGKGLRLAADSLPEGLVFNDLGDGKSAIEGTPTHPGAVAIHVVATNQGGRTAQMTATIAVAERPPPPTPVSSPPSAAADKPQPPSSPPPPSIAAAPPARPAQAPPAAPASPSPPAQQVARIEPPGPSLASPQGAPPTAQPADPANQFLQRYDGGDCFLVKSLPSAGGARAYLGVGAQLLPFQRFEEAFKKAMGAEPQMSVRLITPAECPAVELLRPGAGEAVGAPKIDLADYRVGRNRPLAGTIANLGGRHVALILVDNDGAAYRIDAKPQPGGDSATFSIPLTPDAGSIGPIQLVLAVVSAKPIAALETFRSGALKSIAPALLEEARSGSASVGAEFFMFAN